MIEIEVPKVVLPEGRFEQLRNGRNGVIFKLSPNLVGKILYNGNRGRYKLRDDEAALEGLIHEEKINKILFENDIGNTPKPFGVDRVKTNSTSYYTLIMEYIHLPRGDEVGPVHRTKAIDLITNELHKAADLGIYPGEDVYNPANFFYNSKRNIVRIIAFERWSIE
jgi:hypothetical protein